MLASNNSQMPNKSKEEENSPGSEKKDASPKRNNKRPSGELLTDNHNGGVTDNDPSHDVSLGHGSPTNSKAEEEYEEEGEGEEGGEETEEDEEEEEEEEDEDGEKKSQANQPRPAPRQLVYTRPSAETIIIECSDDELLEVEKAVAVRMSVAIRKKLETLEPNAILQLDNITGRALTKVMEYCHVHTAPHIISMDLKTWDDKFVKLDPGTLCELASAAYHLEIKPLVDLTCQAIAQLLKGKSPAEIRRTFNILYDFNPEDDAPPPTMRDKLRNKLCNPKRREKTKQLTSSNPTPRETVDTRSVDELVSFINQGKTNKSRSKSSKAAKRARQRERKKQRKTQERLKSSQEKEPEKEGNISKEKSKGSLSKSQEKEDQEDLELSEEKDDATQQRHKLNGLKNSGDPPVSPRESDLPPLVSSPRDTTDVGDDTSNTTGVKNGTKKRSTGAQQNPKESKKSKNVEAETRKQKTKGEKPLSSSSEDDTGPILDDDEIWEEDEDDMDPELKAQQDREVEEFRMRLEQINNTTNRARIPLPSTLSLALIDTLKG